MLEILKKAPSRVTFSIVCLQVHHRFTLTEDAKEKNLQVIKAKLYSKDLPIASFDQLKP